MSLALLALGTVGLVAAQASETPKLTAECLDTVVFFARGNDAPYHDGRTTPFLDATCAKLVAEGKTCDYIDIKYDVTLGGPFCTQVSEGVSNGIAQITAFQAQCPCTHIAIGGYSEGANVVGDILGGGGCLEGNTGIDPISAAGKAIAAVTVWGDPRHAANQPYNVLDGSSLQAAPRDADAVANLLKYASVLRNYCAAGDPICAGGNNVTEHLNYFDLYTDDAASWVVGKVDTAAALCDATTSSVASASATASSSSSIATPVVSDVTTSSVASVSATASSSSSIATSVVSDATTSPVASVSATASSSSSIATSVVSDVTTSPVASVSATASSSCSTATPVVSDATSVSTTSVASIATPAPYPTVNGSAIVYPTTIQTEYYTAPGVVPPQETNGYAVPVDSAPAPEASEGPKAPVASVPGPGYEAAVPSAPASEAPEVSKTPVASAPGYEAAVPSASASKAPEGPKTPVASAPGYEAAVPSAPASKAPEGPKTPVASAPGYEAAVPSAPASKAPEGPKTPVASAPGYEAAVPSASAPKTPEASKAPEGPKAPVASVPGSGYEAAAPSAPVSPASAPAPAPAVSQAPTLGYEAAAPLACKVVTETVYY